MKGFILTLHAALLCSLAAALPPPCGAPDASSDCTWAGARGPLLVGRNSARPLAGGSVITPPAVFHPAGGGSSLALKASPGEGLDGAR